MPGILAQIYGIGENAIAKKSTTTSQITSQQAQTVFPSSTTSGDVKITNTQNINSDPATYGPTSANVTPRHVAPASTNKETDIPTTDNSQEISSQDAVNLLQKTYELKGRANWLNDYYQSTYKFKLFMTNEEDLFQGETPATIKDVYKKFNGGSIRQVVLAQTGVTGYIIGDVNITAVVGPTFRTRNTNSTGFEINISEPMGTNFLDAIRSAAIELNIQNFAKVWYYLELSFQGYGENGNVIQNALSNVGLSNGGIWIWQIQITDIATKLTETGTEYKLTALPYDDIALDSDIQRIPDSLNISGSTIGEYFDSLANGLTSAYHIRYGGEILKISIKNMGIRVQPDMVYTAEQVNAFIVSPAEQELNSIRMYNEDGLPTAQIQRGTSITDVINQTFANCEITQKFAIGDPDKTTKDMHQTIVFQVEPEIKITGYDILSNQYKREITYKVWGYSTQIPIINEKQVEDAKDETVQKKMANSLYQRGFLNKRYDYIFTGKNTEITDLDLSYNMSWSAILPKLRGYRASKESVEVHQKFNDAIAFGRSYLGQVDDLLAQIEQLNTIQRNLTEASKQPLSAEQQAKIREDLYQNSLQLKSTEQALQFASDNLAQARAQAEAQARLQSENDVSSKKPKRIYAEDLVNDTSKLSNMPVISFWQDDQSKIMTGIGFTDPYHRNKSIYGAVLDQLYSPLTQQFIRINMGIKGDPYWLGAANLERRVAPPTIGLKSLLPNYFEGDNTLLLTFRYPNNFGEEGIPVIREQDVFNRIYRVVGVVHKFSGGQFHQSLDAVVLPLLDILKAFNLKLDRASETTGTI